MYMKFNQCFFKALATTVSAAPALLRKHQRACVPWQHLVPHCVFMTQAQRISGSMEGIHITSSLSLEQSVIIKLNRDHLHANKNANKQ